jgi:hypothetical protein
MYYKFSYTYFTNVIFVIVYASLPSKLFIFDPHILAEQHFLFLLYIFYFSLVHLATFSVAQ